MAFLGRLDFYREYGFCVVDRRNLTGRQEKYDAAAMRLSELKVSEVIEAAIDDEVRDRDWVRPLIDNLMNQTMPSLMRDYLKPMSDDWENRCDEYVYAIEALKNIPAINRKYIEQMRVTSIGVPLRWNESELQTLDDRLMRVQERVFINSFGSSSQNNSSLGEVLCNCL